MIKKGVFIFLFLFLIPSALATITINGPTGSKYNLGDQADISGYIYEDNAVSGFLNLAVNCGNNTFNLPTISISLAEKEKKLFPGDIKLPPAVVSSSMLGSCYIKMSLLVDAVIVDEGQSDVFLVTKELDGSFDVDKNKVQVGMPIVISGEIYKLNGKNTDGGVELYLRSGDNRYLMDIINTANGKFTYEYTPIANPEGIYYIDIIVNDMYGNSQLFERIASVELVSNYDILLKMDKISYMPGEKVDLEGEVADVSGNAVQEGGIIINLDDNVYKTNLKYGIFTYSFILPNNIKTGKHELAITIKDNFGNSGYKNVSLYVNALPEKLGINFKKNRLNPGEEVEVTPYVYDQAGDVVDEEVSVEVFDPVQKSLFSDVIKSGAKTVFKLSRFAVPGFYTITTRAVDLQDKDKFIVNSVVDAEVTLSNQTVYIKNTGNVDYKKPVKFDFNNGQYSVLKQVSLKPEENAEFYLDSMEVSTGLYALDVKYGDKERSFENVQITVKEKMKFNYIYLLYAFLIIGLVGGYFFLRKKINLPKRRNLGKGAGVRRVKVNIDKPEKKLKYNFGKADEKDLQDFKSRVLKDIEDTERGKRKGSSGMFNMFNN